MHNDRHFPLAAAAWQPDAAVAAIDRICADALAHMQGGFWPPHTQDGSADSVSASLYLGSAGMVLGLDLLQRSGLLDRTVDFAAHIGAIVERARAETAGGPYPEHGSLLLGEMGAALAAMRLRPEEIWDDRLYTSAAANTTLPPRDLMWGLAGSMLASVFMHEMTAEPRWRDLFQAQARHLLEGFDATAEGWLWTQDLHGERLRYLGPVHGYAGNMVALMRGWSWLDDAQRRLIETTVPGTLAKHAQRFPTGVNWPAVDPWRGAADLCQICHGAAGMVVAFADAPFRSVRLDELLNAGGEFVWQAGPLRKGSGLCHGTGGNGYAFLKLYRRTGQPHWLERARAFAMQAIAQCDAARTAHGRGRFTLWTGDIGLAVYLRDCIAGEARFPTIDVM